VLATVFQVCQCIQCLKSISVFFIKNSFLTEFPNLPLPTGLLLSQQGKKFVFSKIADGGVRKESLNENLDKRLSII